jgi:hypothetical protein
MSLNAAGVSLLDLSPAGVHGLPGLAVHRLGFSFQYRLHHWQPGVIARNFKAIVTLHKQQAIYLGIAWPENAWILQATDDPTDGTFCFRIDLRDADIERIERLRQGHDLVFNLLVQCEVSGPKMAAGTAQDNIYCPVNRATWTDVLAAFGMTRRLLLEVDLPGDAAVGTAGSRLQRARAEHDAGNHDGVVRECRLALESIKNALGLEGEMKGAWHQYTSGQRRAMTKRSRALLMHDLAIHYAHLAHHPDEDGDSVDFGRRDSAFMLAITSAIVSNSLSTEQPKAED